MPQYKKNNVGYNRLLKPLKSGVTNDKSIYAFDIETYQVDRTEGDLHYRENIFYMGALYGGSKHRKIFHDRELMCKFMLSRRFRNCMWFATNLNFDFLLSFKVLTDDFDIIHNNGKIIYAKHRKYNIEFLDTLNYIKASVAQLGSILGVDKIEHPAAFARKPVNEEEEKELQNYCMRDAEISYLFASFLQEFFNSMDCKMKLTISSTGMDNWRRNYQEDYLEQPADPKIMELQYKCYRGGRTEVFKRGYFDTKVDGIISYLDFNSMYPAVCHDGVDGKGSYPFPNYYTYRENIEMVDVKHFEGCCYAELECPIDTYAPLLYDGERKDKLIFKAGLVKGYYTFVEIRVALKEGGYNLIKLGEGIVYHEKFKPFRKIIKDLYSKRLIEKKKGNDPVQNMLKTMMNGGTYGKFGQNNDGREICYQEKDFHIRGDDTAYVIKDGKTIELGFDYTIRGQFVFTKITDATRKLKNFMHPIFASYTTALARIKLWKELKKYGDKIIYCDTDSIIVMEKVVNHSKKLGDLKLECYINKAIFIKPKFYHYEPVDVSDDNPATFKCKGVGKAANSMDKFTKLVETGKVDIERFSGYKESAIRKIPFASILKQIKNLSIEDDKRIWVGSFPKKSWLDSRALV